MLGWRAPITIAGFLGLLLMSSCAKNVRVAAPGVVAKPVIGMFIADPPEVAPGGTTTLRWVVCCTDAETISISPEIGTVPLNGSRLIHPTAAVTYTLTASGSAGRVVARVLIRITAAQRASAVPK